MITLIASVSEDWGLGRDGELLVEIPEDLKHFRSVTKNSVCVMGSKTFDSIIKRNGKPLGDGRLSLVVTSRYEDYRRKFKHIESQVGFTSDIDMVRRLLRATSKDGNSSFICGGAEIYKQLAPVATRAIISHVPVVFEGTDTWFNPEWLKSFREVSRETVLSTKQRFEVVEYSRVDTKRK